jgi:hypothetical protein
VGMYPVRSSPHLYLGEEVLRHTVREDTTTAWGDTVVTNILSLDDEGQPKGNRRERRMAARLLRKRGKGKDA